MDQQSAVDSAEKALQADSKNPTVLAEAARVLAYFTGDIGTSILMLQRALVFDRSPCAELVLEWLDQVVRR
jgi:hypothetical protein